jgi:Spy/CpxP family protein refolding chaperone
VIHFVCCAALASSALLFALPGQAQPGGAAAGERLSRVLDLTEAQQDALRQARREAMAAHREARAEGADRAELRREHARNMREVYESVLSSEQLDKLDGMRDVRRTKQRDRLIETLDLHSDQVDPVLAILSEARPGAGGQDGAGGQQRRAAVREQLSAILTPAQMERFDAMHNERGGRHDGWRPQHRSGS